MGDHIGMIGTKLEAEVLFITCLNHHYDALREAVHGLGVKDVNIIAEPLATSIITISDRQKTLGCLLVNIGAETISISIFEEGNITSLDIFSLGSTDITSDIALGFQVSLNEAEKIKTDENRSRLNYPKRKVDQIIEARLADIFELIDKHLKNMKKQKLLPGGVILVGGGAALNNLNGAALNNLNEYTRDSLQLPSRVVNKLYLKQLHKRDLGIELLSITAYGACFFAIEDNSIPVMISSKKFFKKIKNKISVLLEQFIP